MRVPIQHQVPVVFWSLLALVALAMVGCSARGAGGGGGGGGGTTPSDNDDGNGNDNSNGDGVDPPLLGGWHWHRQEGSKGICMPTYILIHGRDMGDEEEQLLIQIADAILSHLDSEPAFFDDANIAFWYWEDEANGNRYWKDVYEDTPWQGRKLASEIRERMNNREINADPDSVHIIGHNFGGYVGAIAGAEFQEADSGSVPGRLTTLTNRMSYMSISDMLSITRTFSLGIAITVWRSVILGRPGWPLVSIPHRKSASATGRGLWTISCLPKGSTTSMMRKS
jgi:hypothetical protein